MRIAYCVLRDMSRRVVHARGVIRGAEGFCTGPVQLKVQGRGRESNSGKLA